MKSLEGATNSVATSRTFEGRSPTTSRILAHLSRRSPLPFFLALWLVGQGIGYFVDILVTTILACTYVAVLIRTTDRVILAGLSATVVGVLSVQFVNDQEPDGAARAFRGLGLVSGEIRAPKPGKLVVPVTLQAISPSNGNDRLIGRRLLCSTKDLPWRNGSALRSGELVSIRGVSQPFRSSVLPFEYAHYLMRRGFSGECAISFVSTPLAVTSGFVDEIRATIEAHIRSTTGDGEAGGILLAMLIGSNDTLSSELVEGLSRVSLSHVLVVSGYQVTLWHSWTVTIVLLLLSRGALSTVTYARVAALGFVWGYVALVGLEPSCVRAGVAITICELFGLIERRTGDFQSIACAGLVVTTIWPGSFFEMGTQLTFSALVCLRLCSSRLSGKIPPWIAGMVATVCTTAVTSLVMLCWNSEVHPVGIVLNPIVVPTVSLLGGPVAALAYLTWYIELDKDGSALTWIAERCLAVLYWAAEIGAPSSFERVDPNPFSFERFLAGFVLMAAASWVVKILVERARILRGVKLSSIRR